MGQYNRIAEAIQNLNVFPERVQIMKSEPEHTMGLRQLPIDNFSVFYVIEDNRVVVTRVLYSASDISKRLFCNNFWKNGCLRISGSKIKCQDCPKQAYKELKKEQIMGNLRGKAEDATEVQMKNIIYYFSGTGNSLRTAIGIAERIGGAEIISVRCDIENVSAETAEVIGFVCPVYEWDMPGTMKRFVADLKINPNAYIFMVATYIAIHGKSFETMEKILSAKKAHLDYGIALHCVASQCTAYAPFPPEKLMIPYMEKKIGRIGKEISERKSRAYPPMAWLTRKLYSKLMTPYMEVEQEYDKGFYTDERCAGCEICSRICPTQNITIQEKHPVWNHHCHGCMACVAYCPTKAIQFKTPEAYEKLNTAISKRLCLPEKRKRYHNPFITAADLMIDKQYIESKFDTG